MKHKDLQEFGLTSKEAQVYLATLGLGNGTALGISKKAGLPKTTTADILTALVRKGLASHYMKKNKNYYSASDPNIIKEQIEKQSISINRILPQLSALYTSGSSKPKVRYYEGKTGMDIVANELIDEAENEGLVIASTKDVLAKFPREDIQNVTNKRLRKGLHARTIYTNDPLGHELMRNNMRELRETKLINPPVPFSSMIWIWHNKVAFFDVKNEVTIFIIESKEISQTIRMMFESMWAHEPEVG